MRSHFIAFAFYALLVVAASASIEAQDEPLEKVTEGMSTVTTYGEGFRSDRLPLTLLILLKSRTAVLCKKMPTTKPTRKLSKKPRRPTKKPRALPTQAPTTQPTQSAIESQAPWPIRIRYPVSLYTEAPTSPPSTYAEAPYADWIDPVKYPLAHYTHPPTSTPSGRVVILTQHPTYVADIDNDTIFDTLRPQTTEDPSPKPFTFSPPSLAPTYVEFLQPQGP